MTRRGVLLLLGPAAAAVAWGLLPAGGLTPQGRLTLALAVWMAAWWLTEALPLEATALLPLAALPALNIASLRSAAAPYADPTIFFFMGGMMLGAAMERWGLPQRFALHVLSRTSASPRLLILGAMSATAFISMWLNNTSTCVMMLPIGLSIVKLVERRAGEDHPGVRNFSTAMVLGIAWAATIGGVGTLFGTAPNIILQANIEKLANARLTFAQYSAVGMPLVLLYLPAAWLVIVGFYPPDVSADPETRAQIRRELDELGPITAPEVRVLAVLGAAMVLWALQDPLNGVIQHATERWSPDGKGFARVLSEAGIAVMGALALFLLPARLPGGGRTTVLDWPTANSIQWGILVLFGGGLSLAEAMTATGVNSYLGSLFRGLEGVPPVLVILCVAAFVTFATEVASNTAIATTFLPVAYAGAEALHIHPYSLMFPVALSASYAYMMPMGTPPNAMAMATRRVRIGQMARAGFVLNLIAIAMVTALSALVVPLIAPRQ